MKGRTDKRQAIMQAAENLFTGRRIHEITMDDVAAAGVAKGTLYTYFADKDELFFQTGTSGFEELCDLIHHKVSEDVPFTEQLLAAVADILARGAAENLLRADLPPEVLANILLDMLRTRVRDLKEVAPPLRDYQAILDLFCNCAGCRRGVE